MKEGYWRSGQGGLQDVDPIPMFFFVTQNVLSMVAFYDAYEVYLLFVFTLAFKEMKVEQVFWTR